MIKTYRSKKFQAKNVRRRAGTRALGNSYRPYGVRGTNPQNSVVFRGIGFPDALTTNLVYSDSIILTPSVGTPLPRFTYRLTSLFDPQFSLGGAQPTYFDQLAAVYERYVVNGAKITVVFSRSSTTSTNIGPYICGISCADNDSLPGLAASAQMSQPNTTFEVVSQDGGNKTVVATYSKSKTYGLLEDNLQARVTSDPAVNWLANVWASPQGVDATTPINCVVIIEYNATFSGVKDIVDV